jgi:protein-S-isoprenylcysteine O-methyltransferase Ste14
MKGFPDLPPIWFAGFCLAAWLLARELPLVLAFGPVFWGLGLVPMLTGYVLWLGALSAALLPGLFISVLTLRFIQPEEERLIDAFGLEARRYMQTTGRWL